MGLLLQPLGTEAKKSRRPVPLPLPPLETPMATNPVGEGEEQKALVKIYRNPPATENPPPGGYPMGASLFSPDGNNILTRKDNKLQVVDLKKGTAIVTLEPVVTEHWSATYSPDGHRIAVVTTDPSTDLLYIALCKSDTGEVVKKLVPPKQQPNDDDAWKKELERTARVSFSADGKQLAAQNTTQAVWVWDLTTYELLYQTAGFLSRPDKEMGMPLLLSPQDGALIEVDAARQLHFTRVLGKGKKGDRVLPRSRYLAEANAPLLVSFSPDGDQFLLGWENQVIVGQTKTGLQLFQVEVPRFRIHTAGYSKDGKTLAIVYGNNSVLMLHGTTGEVVGQWDTVSTSTHRSLLLENIRRLSFSPDGKQLVTWTQNPFPDAKDSTDVTQVWEASSGKLLSTWSQQSPTFAWATLSADGKQVMATLDDNTLRVWDVESGQPVFTQSGGASHFHRAAYTPDGTRIVADGEDGMVRVWNAQNGTLAYSLGHSEGSLRFFHVSQEGSQLVTLLDVSDDPYISGKYNTINFWNAATGKKLSQSIPLVQISSQEPQVFLDGSRYAYVFSQHSLVEKNQKISLVKLVDPEKNEITLRDPDRDADGRAASVVQFAISPDGTQGVTLGSTNKLHIWDTKEGRVLHSLVQEPCGDLDVNPAYSTDGTQFATVCNQTLTLRQATDGASKQTLSFPEKIASVAFFAANHLALSGQTEVAVFVRKDSGWEQIWKKPLPARREGVSEERVGVAKEGNNLLMRGPKELQVVNGTTGDVIQTIPMPVS